jgi:hypothetical protein
MAAFLMLINVQQMICRKQALISVAKIILIMKNKVVKVANPEILGFK